MAEQESNTMHVHHSSVEQDHLLPSPFPDTVPDLTEPELREAAYEILVAACRSSELKPLTFNRSKKSNNGSGGGGQRSPSLHRSVSNKVESKVKKEMGLKRSVSEAGKRSFRAARMGELMRVQMRVSEMTDTRIRRALLRIAASKLGKRIESMVLPLELIVQLKCSDFPNQQEYKSWLRRNLKIIKAGLLLHPHSALDNKADCSAQYLQQIIHRNLDNSMDIGNNIESMQNLHSVVMSLACRTNDESINKTCHWADGFPLNLKIYQTLLEACFDNMEVTIVIEEVDEVLELIKKTWIVLGMNEILHNLCFSWVMFHRYVVTGQVENDLIFASSNLLAKAEEDVESVKDPFYSKYLRSMLGLMLSWAEKRLCAYHGSFSKDNIESMQSIFFLALSSAKILVQDECLEHNKMKKEANESCTRIENYIRSSLRYAFTKKLETLRLSKHASKKQNKALLLSLAALAQGTSELALYEKEIFSPILKRWHPLASGVAAATLHVCYGNELKQYVKRIKQLTPDAVEMLVAADKLEKDLAHIAAEDSFDSEDGGKSIIREMQPYDIEAVIANLVRSWIKTRVDIVEEWIDRSLQKEVWNSRANDGIAPSAVEVLRVIDDSLEAFFQLPIPKHAVLLPRLISDLDNALQQYILKARTGCGHRDSFIPTVPALTRCSTGSKLQSLFGKKEKSPLPQRRKSQVETANIDSSFGLPQLCVRVNTMKHIQRELKVLENRTNFYLGSSESSNENDTKADLKFSLSALASMGGINHLSEVIAYKVVFHDLSHVLWDGLYVGEVSSTRIEPFLEELEQCLNIISSTVNDDSAKTQILIEVMEACFEGFLLVLLAGGPSRAFSPEDYFIMKEDFKFLTDLFRSNGYGLPVELIEKRSTNVEGVLPLFGMSTESLIQQFSQVSMGMYGSSAKSPIPLPQASTQFRPSEPNTLLHVLGHRNDERATKYLKKNYNLPTKL